MAIIFRLFMDELWSDLTYGDLAALARVSRELNDLVNPYLYHTVRLHSPGHIDAHDKLLMKLDTLAHPEFNKMGFIKRVIVSGTWYSTYASIDSWLAPKRILSPAARLLSSLLCSCVVRMPNLEEFVWDMQVSLTQYLVSNVVLRPMLRTLQLRMGTDCTPKPFFRPPLNMKLSMSLTVLSLVQVDDAEVMRSVGAAVASATNLRELTIWADNNSGISVSTLFESWPTHLASQLHLLDLRGFAALGVTPADFWAMLRPSKLTTVTLDFLDPNSLATTVRNFWDAGLEADFRPVRLTTNILDNSIDGFLRAFSGLEAFHGIPIRGQTSSQLVVCDSLLEVLETQHGATLKVLGLSLPCHEDRPCSCAKLLTLIASRFPQLEELRIRQDKVDLEAIKSALSLPKLQVLYIDIKDDFSAPTSEFLSVAEGPLREGYGKELRYLAFSDDTTYEYLREEGSFSNAPSLVGYIRGTVLLHEKMYDWVGTAV
ncbi:hypothetical protein ASPACDRAFT_64075 [Aspergillus aculeatus ATCC 16872]|uniref:F-box domain-containing protein n=1 Tax=Aspergillus aculeatus (strain ATCC 16872 / CBS 172.66 / WB 5094) TaxID=690307 RepID=A0A1L9WHI4_ASPA1|nr:uncharacterized protein ASPACDRAFT_64075 [Aspergillus aculeatus ATCC 16872]OJJ95575.1 hypothetical protein ASPACDRAFT_64075 [Aspergillus aculeatus ATCC 16872]